MSICMMGGVSLDRRPGSIWGPEAGPGARAGRTAFSYGNGPAPAAYTIDGKPIPPGASGKRPAHIIIHDIDAGAYAAIR
jgi:hypothetical protein